jgi:hypothetical protein
MPTYHLATFSCDVTPPEGHPLCGGWIEPVRGVDDPLRALGVVLLGCAPKSLDLAYFDDCVKRSAEALTAALPKAIPFTHIGTGSAAVKEVASNRRIVGADGKVKFTRTSATKSKDVRDEPVGLIDPLLRTLSFWYAEKPLVALHFYACHPMSYYGDGRVSADFCGLARQKRQDETGVFQLYFNGCGGNITAGKYNDGAKENRAVLRDKIYTALVAAWKETKRIEVNGWDWRFEAVKLPPRKEFSFSEESSTKALEDPKAAAAKRNNGAFQLAWLMRKDVPIELNCLDFGGNAISLFLPGEAFVEYQLAAKKMRSDAVVNVAAYGDDGPGYIPTDRAYLEGGYEPTVALAGPESEEILLTAIRKLLKKP